MKYLFALLFFLGSVSLISCNSGNTEVSKDDTVVNKADATPATRIRNNIKLESNGIKVSQAFLLYEDGKLVPESNETAVGEPLKLRLVIDKGWQEKDGKVSLGASERIETSDGKLVLDEKDLFENTTIDAEAANLLSLTAVISGLDRLYDYFLVSFRVWDKYGTGEVKGSYKLYIKAD